MYRRLSVAWRIASTSDSLSMYASRTYSNAAEGGLGYGPACVTPPTSADLKQHTVRLLHLIGRNTYERGLDGGRTCI